MFDYNSLSTEERAKIDERVALGYGELVPVTVKELVVEERLVKPSKAVESKGEDGETVVDVEEAEYETVKSVRERELQLYVGRLTAGQTGVVMQVLGAVFVNGMSLRELVGRKDNAIFLEFLDEHHLTYLTAGILYRHDRGRQDGPELTDVQEWVSDNWDLAWVLDVYDAFLRYNDFFGLFERIAKKAQERGVTEEAVRNIALGSKKK